MLALFGLVDEVGFVVLALLEHDETINATMASAAAADRRCGGCPDERWRAGPEEKSTGGPYRRKAASLGRGDAGDGDDAAAADARSASTRDHSSEASIRRTTRAGAPTTTL